MSFEKDCDSSRLSFAGNNPPVNVLRLRVLINHMIVYILYKYYLDEVKEVVFSACKGIFSDSLSQSAINFCSVTKVESLCGFHCIFHCNKSNYSLFKS